MIAKPVLLYWALTPPLFHLVPSNGYHQLLLLFSNVIFVNVQHNTGGVLGACQPFFDH